jgi:hypothetical protein
MDVRKAYENAAQIELYSLDPHFWVENNKAFKSGAYHGWEPLGKTTLKGDDARKVLNAVDKGRSDSDGKSFKCFDPRHGIRIVAGQKIYDLVICYACGNAMIFEGDKDIGGFLTTGSPAAILNKVLVDSKVPLPKMPGR